MAAPARTPRLAEIVALVVHQLGVSEEELRGPGRFLHLREARALVYHLARKHTRLSWRAIAAYSMGGRHYDTVRRDARALVAKLRRDRALASVVSGLDSAVQDVRSRPAHPHQQR